MSRPTVTPDEMLANNVMRFAEAKPQKDVFLDTLLPEYQRRNYNIIGESVYERAESAAAIKGAHGFHMGMIELDPGKGAGLHAHKTREVFMPLDGDFVVFWGDDGEHELTLKKWDVVSMPVGVMRGFRNPNDTVLHVMAVVGKDDLGGPLEWSDKLVDDVRAKGGEFDEAGKLTDAEG